VNDPATITGRVAGTGTGPIAARALLEVEGARHTRALGERITVVTDDDREVIVELPARCPGVGFADLAGPWRTAGTDPRAALFDDVAPGDHVAVQLTGWAVAPGMTITVRGELVDAALDGGDYRDAPTSHPRRVRARSLAIGSAAAQLAAAPAATPAASPAAAPRSARVPGRALAIVCGALGGLAVLAWAGGREAMVLANFRAEPAAYELAAGCALLIAAALALASTPGFERVQLGAEPGAASPTWSIGGAFVIFGALLATAGVYGWLTPTSLGAVAIAWGAAGCGLTLAVWLFARHAGARGFGRLIVRARPIALDDPAFGRFAGVVIEGHLERSVTYRTRVERRERITHDARGYQRWRTVRNSYLAAEPAQEASAVLRVRVGDRTVDVETNQAAWAAPIAYLPIPAGSPAKVLAAARIGAGDAVVVLGRIKADGARLVVRATGPESLLIFGAPGDASAVLRAVMRGWAVRLWAPIFAIAAAVTAGVHIWDYVHR
jgi:hypothetical protein